MLWWTRCETSQGDQEVHHLAPAHLHHHNHLVKVTVIKKFLASPLHISSGVNPPPPMTSTYPQQQASAPPLHGHQYPAAGYPPQVYLTKVSYSTLCPLQVSEYPPSASNYPPAPPLRYLPAPQNPPVPQYPPVLGYPPSATQLGSALASLVLHP